MHYYKNDIDDDVKFVGDIAIDTEAMGLKHNRDRLCVIQICDENNDIHIIHFTNLQYHAPNLRLLLSDDRQKIFHFARFDVAIIQKYLDFKIKNIYCTKIASKIARTYTDQHSLKELCSELLGIKLSKQQQSSYWGDDNLTTAQLNYAAADVVHLHQLRSELNRMITREQREYLLDSCLAFLPSRIALDSAGWDDIDIFSHK